MTDTTKSSPRTVEVDASTLPKSGAGALPPVLVGSLEIYKRPDGTVSVENMMIRDDTGAMRRAVVNTPPRAGHKLVEPVVAAFFEGNCFWYNGRWYC
jgi:hypothetical protein